MCVQYLSLLKREALTGKGKSRMGMKCQELEADLCSAPITLVREAGAQGISHRPQDQPWTQENRAGWILGDHTIYNLTTDGETRLWVCCRFVADPRLLLFLSGQNHCSLSWWASWPDPLPGQLQKEHVPVMGRAPSQDISLALWPLENCSACSWGQASQGTWHTEGRVLLIS